MKNKVIISTLLLITAVLGIIVFNEQGKPTAEDTLEIGAILNLTGTDADQGEQSRNGILMAVDEINDAGGVLDKELRVNFQDNQGDNPREGLSALHTLVRQDVRIVIGPNQTPTANSLSPILQELGVLMIAPSVGSEKFAEESHLAFNLFSPNKFESYALAHHLYDTGKRRIAILGYQQEWSMEQAHFVQEKFEELGGTVEAIAFPLMNDRDLRTDLFKLKNTDAEAIVFTNWANTGIAAKQLREIGVETPFYSILFPPEEVTKAQGALEGLVFITTDSHNDTFNDTYRAIYGHDAGFSAAQSYDIVHILAHTITSVESAEPEKVADAIHTMGVWNGASGDVNFDEDGNNRKKGDFYQIVDGEATLLE